MNALPAILLHGAFFVAGASAVLWFFRRQSAARVSAGTRLIIAGTLALATGEFVSFQISGRSFHSSIVAEPSVSADIPLPQAPLAAGPASALPLPPEITPAAWDVDARSATGGPGGWPLPGSQASVLTAVWMAGAALILLYRMFALAARQWWIRKASRVTAESWHELLRSIPGGKRIARLLRHPGAGIPCTWGLLRPVILLPGCAEEWPQSQRRMVLAHECAHIARRDPLWQPAGQLFLALQWFNPVAWLLLRSLRMTGERAADDAVLAMETDAPAYAELLVHCARQWSSTCGIDSVSSFMARPSTVARRVKAILHPSTDRRPAGLLWSAWGSAGCIVLAGMVVVFSPRLTVTAEEPPTPSVQPAPEAPKPDTASVSGGIRDLKVTSKPADGTSSPRAQSAEEVYASLDSVVIPAAKFADAPMEKVLRELSQLSGVGLNWSRDTGEKNVSVEWPRASLRTALEAVCKASGRFYTVNVWHHNGGGSHADIFIRDEISYKIQTYLVPETLAATCSKPGELSAALKKAGILFPDGAFDSTDLPTRRLVVKNTQEQLRRVTMFLETGSADGPYPWHPVKIQDLEYVSTADVEGFYDCRNFDDGSNPSSVPAGTRMLANSRFLLTLRMSDSFAAINGIRFVLAHPLVEQNGQWWISREDLAGLLDPALQQSAINPSASFRTVVIDPGHGGEDSGAVSDGLKESTLNLDLALELRKALEANGLKVVMTRTDDTYSPRSQRVAVANTEPDSIFISLHFDSRPGETHGIETRLLTSSGPPEIRSQTAGLGLAVHRACLTALKADGGITANPGGLLAGLKSPGILIEAGNLMNPGDRALITDGAWRVQLAAAIAAGIHNYSRPAAAPGKSAPPASPPAPQPPPK